MQEKIKSSELLKNIVESRNMSLSGLASALGIARQSLYNKLDGRTEFTGAEIKRITALLELSPEERDIIFLS